MGQPVPLHPVLLGSTKYAPLRSHILRVQEAVDIQVGGGGGNHKP
jgi:hypothetical protein